MEIILEICKKLYQILWNSRQFHFENVLVDHLAVKL